MSAPLWQQTAIASLRQVMGTRQQLERIKPAPPSHPLTRAAVGGVVYAVIPLSFCGGTVCIMWFVWSMLHRLISPSAGDAAALIAQLITTLCLGFTAFLGMVACVRDGQTYIHAKMQMWADRCDRRAQQALQQACQITAAKRLALAECVVDRSTLVGSDKFYLPALTYTVLRHVEQSQRDLDRQLRTAVKSLNVRWVATLIAMKADRCAPITGGTGQQQTAQAWDPSHGIVPDPIPTDTLNRARQDAINRQDALSVEAITRVLRNRSDPGRQEALEFTRQFISKYGESLALKHITQSLQPPQSRTPVTPSTGVKALWERAAATRDINLLETLSEHGDAPDAMPMCERVIRLALRRGCNARDRTRLHKLTKHLLAALPAPCQGQLPKLLHWAVIAADVDLTRILLQAGADPDSDVDDTALSARTRAALACARARGKERTRMLEITQLLQSVPQQVSCV